MDTTIATTPGEDTTDHVWVFAAYDAGHMDVVRVFAMEAAADSYALTWLAEQYTYTLTGDATHDWCELDRRCARDETLSWMIASQPVEGSSRVPAVPVRDAATVLFDQLEAADGASESVSRIVDALERTCMAAGPLLKLDPEVLLHAVILTARQRLDDSYGVIVDTQRSDPAPLHGGRMDHATPIDASTWSTDDAVQAGGADEALHQNVDDAVSSAIVGVLAEAEALIDACPMLDTHRAVALIVRKLRDFGHLG